MGVSTNGQLAYGFIFEEDYEFPWDEFDEIEDWWLSESGWEATNENPFTEEGGYKPGFSYGDPRVDAYCRERQAELDRNPLPFEIVNCQSEDYPVYMLAVTGTVYVAHRGFPQRITSEDPVINLLHLSKLTELMAKYDLTPEQGPGWFLSSYWG